MPNLQRFGTGESPVASAKLNLIVDAMTGAGNTPVNHGGLNDPLNYALTLKNADAGGKTLIVYAPDGVTVLLQVTATGVLASASGGTAGAILTGQTPLSAVLAADQALGAIGTPTNVLTLSLTAGKWVIVAKASCLDTAGAAHFDARLWDGTTIFDTGRNTSSGANNYAEVVVVAVVTPAATTTYTFGVADASSGNGVAKANPSGASATGTSMRAWKTG